MVSGMQLMEKFLFKIAKQWIAGDTVDDALISAKNACQTKRHAIINKLGEYHTSKKQINTTMKEYQKITHSFRKLKIRGAISVKPTQIGLSISQKEFYRNFEKIIQAARNAHVFVWLDMESSEHTDETIEIYHTFFSKYERLGIALQANLKRTENDLRDLQRIGAKIRLVKGAYRENAKISFKSKKSVDDNYLKLMKKLFETGTVFTTENPISEKINFSSISAHQDANFTEIKSVLQSALKTGFGIKIETKTATHPTFEEGRCATVIVNNKPIGIIGEVNSKIIEKYKIRVPVVGFEISLSESILKSL